MRPLRLCGLAVLALLVAAPARAQSACAASGDVVVGTLQEVTASHPNGASFKAFVLVLAPPRCIQTDGERVAAARRVQLGGSAPQQAALRRRLDAPLSVRIRDPFTPHTAWHVGDVVVVDYDIVK